MPTRVRTASISGPAELKTYKTGKNAKLIRYLQIVWKAKDNKNSTGCFKKSWPRYFNATLPIFLKATYFP
jgi:hypothetical protein